MDIQKIKQQIPDYINKTADLLISAGYEAYLAGGAVRDIIIGRHPKDFDIATDALPEDIIKIFPKTINTNAHFGTILAIMSDDNGENFDVEITTYRQDEEYIGGRWPSKVIFTRSIKEDLARRDLTINAMALNLKVLWDATSTLEEVLVDPFGGQLDIVNHIIKAVGIPIKRFEEDGLRAYRACRLASELNYEIEKNTMQAIKDTLSISKQVSIERVRDEFVKMLMYSTKPSYGIELFRKTGLLQQFLPELIENIGVVQPEWHNDDVYTHSLKTLDLAEDSIKIAALLHDIGKAATISKDERGTHFYGHDKYGAELVEKILRRLRFSNVEIKRISLLVRWHMFYYPSADWRKEFKVDNIEGDIENIPKNGGWSDAAIRRFIKNVGGEEIIDDLFKVRIADATANPKSEFNPIELEALERRISKVRAEDMALKVTDLDITGTDLIEVGIPKGPKIGQILQQLLDLVIDDPKLNVRKVLLNEVQKQLED